MNPIVFFYFLAIYCDDCKQKTRKFCFTTAISGPHCRSIDLIVFSQIMSVILNMKKM